MAGRHQEALILGGDDRANALGEAGQQALVAFLGLGEEGDDYAAQVGGDLRGQAVLSGDGLDDLADGLILPAERVAGGE